MTKPTNVMATATQHFKAQLNGDLNKIRVPEWDRI